MLKVVYRGSFWQSTFLPQLVIVLVLITIIASEFVLPNVYGLFIDWPARMAVIEKHRAGGTIRLLAERLETVEPDKRVNFLEEFKKSFGSVVAIHSFSREQLTDQQRNKLKRGDIVFAYPQRNLYQWLKDSDQLLVFENLDVMATHFHIPSQHEVSAVMNVLQQELLFYPEHQWNEAIQLIAGYFDFPVTLSTLSQLMISEAEKEQLLVGNIVNQETQASLEFEGIPDFVYKKFPDSDKVIVVGPLSDMVSTINREAMIRYFGLIGFIIVIPLIVWLTPSWRSSNYLLRATEQFGRGDLSARSKRVKASHLNGSSIVFNHMAEKVENLFNSNIMLTHAVSHELRTPLTRIEFALEIYRSDQSRDNRRKQVDRMHQAVSELKNMSSEMLLYSRFDREKPDFNLEPTDIKQWVIIEKNKWLIEPTDINLSVIALVDKVTVMIEPFYLSRAIDNLVRNSVRHAHQCVHVQVEHVAEQCLISVENDGPPIVDADKQKVFEPFVRLDESRARDSGGAGLGLAIVQQIVNWHHGRVWIEDSLMGGVKFVLALPLQVINDE